MIKLFFKEIAKIFLLSEIPHDKTENTDEERTKQIQKLFELKQFHEDSNSNASLNPNFFKINIIVC